MAGTLGGYLAAERVQVHELDVDHALDKARHVGARLGVDQQVDGVHPALHNPLVVARQHETLLAVVVLAAVHDDEQVVG